MHVIILKNYKLKLISGLLLICLWVSMYFFSNFFQNGKLLLNISIDNYLTFSYPLNLKVQKIYVNGSLSNREIQATTILSTPSNNKFNSIKALADSLSFSFPSTFTLNEKVISGGEILYHVDFNDRSKDINGFVQVWNLNTPLKEFLEQSKYTSLQSFSDFSMSPINVNGASGYKWSYTSKGETQTYKSMEVFLQKGSKMYRVSYFTPIKLWNKAQENIYNSIVNSIKIKD